MSSFSPNPAELALVNQIFNVADPQKLGIVTGDAAVKVFGGAKLAPTVLGEVWAIADKDNNGFLTRKGVAIALRLIGHAQKGEPVNESLLDRPGPIAHIEGISPPPKPSSIPSSPPPTSPSPRGSQYPPLTPEDKSKFLRLFVGCGPVNGLLSGDKARDVFVKSKLPFEKLSQIWTLADTQDRGSLDQTDFTIAMYLIQAIMAGQLANLPATLPPGLYEQAGGRAPPGVTAHSTGNSVSLSPSLTGSFASSISGAASQYTPTSVTAHNAGSVRSRLVPQGTGQDNRLSTMFHAQPQIVSGGPFGPQNPVTALGASAFGGGASAQQQPWDVTADEKARFDKFYDGLDTQRRGYIEGDIAVPFMTQSKLSMDTLAQVWDLADLNNDGHLTREGFAVAMHLIQNKLAGKEIPEVLPYSLIPPSMRASQNSGTTRAPALPTVPEPVRDLLWDDSPPASATAPHHPGSPMASPPSVQPTPILQPQGTSQVSQQPTGGFGVRSPPVTQADPFGASAYGDTAFTQPAHRDLLSDDEDTNSASNVPDNSAEIGNLKNQISSTNRSLETTKADRQDTEKTLATQASQLSALQTQLSSAKAAYETETRLLSTLRERFATQTADIQKTREELIRAESDLSAVRVEKAEIEGGVLRDKEEVRDLQRKMREVGEEAEQMKVAVEKAKKETKHQKGLLAIARKQLATRETERAKVAKELEEAEVEARETAKEMEAAEEDLAKEPPHMQTNGMASPHSGATPSLPRTDTPSFAATHSLPASPSMSASSLMSPSSKSNNPFERLVTASTGSPSPRPSSPFRAPSADLFSAPTPQPGQPEIPRTASPFSALASPDAASPPFSDVPRAASPFIHVGEPAMQAPPAGVPNAASPFMHVAEASMSTATEPRSATDTDSPFDSNDAEDKSGSETSVVSTPEKPGTPQPQSTTAESSSPVVLGGMTPATGTADTISTDPKGKKPEAKSSSSLDAAATQFPPIDSQIPGSFPGFDDTTEGHTDLDSKLVEKETEESDSDSDVDGEFHDAKTRLSMVSPGDDTSSPIEDKALGGGVPAMGNGAVDKPDKSSNSFEDAFGLKPATPKTDAQAFVAGLPPSNDLLEGFFSKSSIQASSSNVNGKAPESFDIPPSISGVNAFDEAMGKITSSESTSTAPQFKLDSAFDDDFDFTAAKVDSGPSPFPPPSEPLPAVNGSSAPTKPSLDFDAQFGSAMKQAPEDAHTQAAQGQENKLFSFEDAFGSVSSRVSAQPSAGDHGISFEDAFGGGANKALALDDAFTDTVPAKGSPAAAEPKQGEPKAAPFPVQSPPGSPTVPTMPASPSTVRSTSPPPRVNSPKPRVSTGSSNEGIAPSRPPPRHSKLSIRLPFGRKDKKKSKHDPPPVPPPQFLSPVAEPTGSATPAVEDDVEPVKQLCGMGFSRTQAVTALEKHGYDVQRALNSLLGVV